MNNNKNDIRLDKATRSGKFHHRACLLKKGPFIFVCTFWTISKGATLCYWFRQFKNVMHWHVSICIAQRRLRVQVRSISCTCPRGSAGLIQVMPCRFCTSKYFQRTGGNYFTKFRANRMEPKLFDYPFSIDRKPRECSMQMSHKLLRTSSANYSQKKKEEGFTLNAWALGMHNNVPQAFATDKADGKRFCNALWPSQSRTRACELKKPWSHTSC